MSFKMIFEATDKAVTYDDKAKFFRVTGFLAICRMEAPRGGAVNRIYLEEKRPDR